MHEDEVSFYRGDKICLDDYHVEEVQEYQEGVFKTWCYVRSEPYTRMMMMWEKWNLSRAKFWMIGGRTS